MTVYKVLIQNFSHLDWWLVGKGPLHTLRDAVTSP